MNIIFVDKALQDAKASLEEVQEHMKAWEAQFTSTDKKLRAERATSSTLKVHAGSHICCKLVRTCTYHSCTCLIVIIISSRVY